MITVLIREKFKIFCIQCFSVVPFILYAYLPFGVFGEALNSSA